MSKVQLLDEQRKIDQQYDELIDGKIGQQLLSSIFNLSNIVSKVSMDKLKQIGGEFGIAQQFGIDLNTGLQDVQAEKQRSIYGSNLPVTKPFTPILTFVFECFGDFMIQVLLVAAIISTIFGMIKDKSTGWIEGMTIFLAVFLITAITTSNNYFKERQFRKLQSKLDESLLEVKRNGQIVRIDSKQLVVGDVLLFSIGDAFSVDGIIIEGSSVKIDESSLTGESDEQKKIPFSQLIVSNEQFSDVNPFILSGTKVLDGQGQILVLAVGELTQANQMKKLLEIENPPTPLQQKLESVAEDIGKLGTVVAIITFIVLIIRYSVDCANHAGQCEDGFQAIDTLKFIVDSFMIGVTIIVVAVPEGLPLAVTITLAFSVNRMKDENNLVKTLASCEVMGGANNICTDKTGTLTQNQMKVVQLYFQGQNYSVLNQFIEGGKIFVDSVCYNSNSYPQKNQITGKLDQTGNKTECALLSLANDWGFDYNQYRPSHDILLVIPFNSSRKRMITVVYSEENQGVMIYVKGASEMILSDSQNILLQNGMIQELDEVMRNKIQVQINQYAQRSLRTLSLAYKLINDLKYNGPDARSAYSLWLKTISEEFLLEGLTLIAIAGIKDPLREEVNEAIQQCHRSGIIVRMVTGDNSITAKAIAKECGILPEEQGEFDKYYVMEGQEFRTMVGGLKKISKQGKEVLVVQNLDQFKLISENLRVLARASPEDKYLLVTGLIQLDNVVAVTGDGTNDAPALRKADVGFAMGISGSDVARDAADIILLDDNFASIVTACKWGRNIYNCIRKFIQFQLTVNLVALFMCVLGSCVLKESPLNTIEMLWVNLIMDTFASLALATEPPSIQVLNKPPYGRKENIVNSIMYRTVFSQTIYQIVVLCYILFFYKFDEPENPEIKGASIKLSMFFQTFVLLQVFNSVTCRKLEEKSLNPFQNLSNNIYYWIIQIITLLVQYLIIFTGGSFLKTLQLDLIQHLICLAFAAGGIIFGILVRIVIPVKIFDKIQLFKEDELDDDQMEQTITSILRKKSSIRLSTNKQSVQKQASLKDSLKRSNIFESVKYINSRKSEHQQKKDSIIIRRISSQHI